MGRTGEKVASGNRVAGNRIDQHARLNGIATSPDGTTIWVTVTGRLPGRSHVDGAVLELPAF